MSRAMLRHPLGIIARRRNVSQPRPVPTGAGLGWSALNGPRSTHRHPAIHVSLLWQLRRTEERDQSEARRRARACLDKPVAHAYVGSCSRRKRASSCPSHYVRRADETPTTAVHGRDQVQPQTCRHQKAYSTLVDPPRAEPLPQDLLSEARGAGQDRRPAQESSPE